ncbi:MAG TPA: capsular biosynthesis protein [Hyphomicrobiales bacterium]|nr:capsular biosynthesis protein [Hyphomicrobiales bacterium]
MERKAFLFLQGPISPFFALVGQGLAAKGHKVRRINFNLGDWLFWRGPETIGYRGRIEAWPAFIARYLDREGITDLVLLGEQRAYHKAAIEAAKSRGIRVTVTDFGYFRPDWITLERDGMSAASTFPRDPELIRALAAGLPPPSTVQRYFDSFRTMAKWDVAYHLALRHDYFVFPHYRSHQLHDPVLTYFGTLRRLLMRKKNNAAAGRFIADILAKGTPYYLFPLQMETDFQLRAYSPFPDLRTPIGLVLGSFAHHAPPHHHLLVKSHPLDPGLRNWRKLIARFAAELGIEGRVHYLDGGNLDHLIRGARGVVTINSTTGIRALQLGCPLAVLGGAIYRVPGLADDRPLDEFWAAPRLPDPALRDAFMAGLAATIQIRGVFYARPGLDAAVAGTVERLHRGLINVPLDALAPDEADAAPLPGPEPVQARRLARMRLRRLNRRRSAAE